MQLPQRRPSELSNKRISKKNKTVNRAYGGHLSHGIVRERCVGTKHKHATYRTIMNSVNSDHNIILFVRVD